MYAVSNAGTLKRGDCDDSRCASLFKNEWERSCEIL